MTTPPSATAQDAYIGVDVGGTHTDVAAVVGDRLERGKALTTYDDFSRGVLDAVTVAAERHGLTLAALLARTRLFVNGTTVVTNALTTLSGSQVGVVVTAGFKDSFRFAGGARQAVFDDHLQVNAPDIFSRRALLEVDERVDWAGQVLAPLDRAALAAGVDRLVEEQCVEALAVCFLNSFLNPANELAALEVIQTRHPGLFVTLSHAVFPVRGENRRWTTAVLNSFVQQGAQAYLDALAARLREAGLTGGLAFFQGLGGGISHGRARDYPLALLGSGPAGGALGANALARRLGAKHVLVGDMGGTSFDTGIIVDNRLNIDKHVDLGLLHTGVNIVDVVSVGAGGGSIAWVGERGVPQVGPMSAKSTPGPACYGRGGTAPTVTDAMVTLGFIDPAGYLGGRFPLDRRLAEHALVADFGARFGWNAEDAAAAIHDLVVVNMADAVREVSVEKGHDPREFLFLAYGGTLPMFAMQIAERLHIDTVVVPHMSSVFCALGLLAANFVLRSDRTVAWDLSNLAQLDDVNALAAQMEAETRAEMRGEGFTDADIEVQRSADCRFLGQSYELNLPLPSRPLTVEDAPRIANAFFALYERTYGEGTAWQDVPTQLLTLTVTVTGRRPHPEVRRAATRPTPAAAMQTGTRAVYLPSERRRREIPIYADQRFTPGSEIAGPAIIDANDTTLFVPPACRARRDELENYVLTRSPT
ncbi:MAG: hydantoinase/oxoprolinase family protein [Gammaproteobacteria bacterium]